MRVVPKVRFFDPAIAGGFSMGLAAPLYLPTGDTDSFNSDGAVRWEPRLIMDWHHEAGIAVSLNVGYQLRPERFTANHESDDTSQ